VKKSELTAEAERCRGKQGILFLLISAAPRLSGEKIRISSGGGETQRKGVKKTSFTNLRASAPQR
jgi:hypothetical protein